MKKLDVNYHPGRDCRELFAIGVNTRKCISTSIGITKEGELLYIKSSLMNNSSAYWVDYECYSIDKAEYRNFLSMARANGNLEKSLRNGYSTTEELEQLAR